MRILLVIFGIFFTTSIWAQATDDLSSSWDKEKNAFVVKQYHEFIERFNFDQKTPIIKFFKRNYPGYPLNRNDLLRSLFNIESNSWDPRLLDAFIADVTQPEKPVTLDFYDDDWYAEVACVFEYFKVQYKGSLILKLYHYENNSSKWQVVGVNADFLPDVQVSEPFPVVRDPTRILNPMSHNADFASLYRAFRDLESLPNFFAREYWNPQINFFFRELKKGSLCLDATEGVTYHLLQIDGWILSLNYYSRNLPNSGILISSLQKADKNDKAGFLKKRLNIR